MRRKNSFLLFLCSCVPGCGQMYQGYMKRGISLVGLFFAIIAAAAVLHISELALLLPVVWLYAFFDSYNLRSQAEAGICSADHYLFGLGAGDDQQLSILLTKRHSIIGWTLIVLGAYSLYTSLFRNWMHTIAETFGLWWFYDFMMDSLPRLVVTVLIIVLGIWFIRGPKKRTEQQEPFEPFTPPEEQKEEQQ